MADPAAYAQAQIDEWHSRLKAGGSARQSQRSRLRKGPGMSAYSSRFTIAILIGAVVSSAAPSPASAMQVGKTLLPIFSFDPAVFKKKKLPKIKFKWPSHKREGQSEKPKLSIRVEEPKITKPKSTFADQIALRQKTEEEATLLFTDAVAELPQSLRNASQQRLREEIEKHVAAILKAEANKPKPRWTFQPTGKLTVNASVGVAGGEIQAGSVNVYIVAGLIAAGIAKCKNSTDWMDCVRKIVVSAINKAMKGNDND
jgi:hypothetical protein